MYGISLFPLHSTNSTIQYNVMDTPIRISALLRLHQAIDEQHRGQRLAIWICITSRLSRCLPTVNCPTQAFTFTITISVQSTGCRDEIAISNVRIPVLRADSALGFAPSNSAPHSAAQRPLCGCEAATSSTTLPDRTSGCTGPQINRLSAYTFDRYPATLTFRIHLRPKDWAPSFNAVIPPVDYMPVLPLLSTDALELKDTIVRWDISSKCLESNSGGSVYHFDCA